MMILQRNSSVGPLLPAQLCGNTVLKYTYSSKCFSIVIDSMLLWRDQVYETCWSWYCNEIIMLKRKTKILHVTFSISLWGSCSPAIFAKIEGLNLRMAKTIHSIPKNNYHGLRRIDHFRVNDNAPSLHPKILHNQFLFSLGTTVLGQGRFTSNL